MSAQGNGQIGWANGLPVFVDVSAPTDRAVRDAEGNETGRREPVLCIRVDGKFYVHPSRLTEFMKAISEGNSNQ